MRSTPRPPVVNFDRVAGEYDATRGEVDRARAGARDVAAHLAPGAVLEIGVGTGILAEALLAEPFLAEPFLAEAPAVRHLAGADISTEMLRQANRRLPGRVVRASAQQLPFPDSTFGSVVAVHVLHLVPDLADVLRVSSPRTTHHSPTELADLVERRSWSRLWDLDDAAWQAHVVPVIDALRALPDQDRPRPQETRTTVTVLETDPSRRTP